MMWRSGLITSVLVASCLSCIPCDKEGKKAMEKYTILIQDQILEETLSGYLSIKNMAYAAQNQIMDYLNNEVRMMDKYTISDVVSEYKKSVDIIAGLEFTGIHLLNVIQLQFQKLQERIKPIIEEAENRLLVENYIQCDTCEEQKVICAGGPPSNQEYFEQCSCVCTKHTCFDLKTGYECTPCKDHAYNFEKVIDCGGKCPNKQDFDNCGLLVENYIQCDTCEEQKIICAGGPPSNQEYFEQCSCVCTKHTCFDLKTEYECTPCKDHAYNLEKVIDCGEKSKVIAENEDLILECQHDWYAKLEDGFKNHFHKNADPDIIVTDEANIEFRGIQKHESGKYTCITVLNSGVPVAKHVYNVKVKERPENVVEEHYLTLPTLPEELDLPVFELPTDEQPVIHHHQHNNTPFLAICGAVFITLILISAICIFIFWWRKKRTTQPQEKV
ncbi:uncharacterized protein [Dendropsophus ebraccatus]|uniref:uncharacterized protein isoform X2 n=1 Tax=Dendropsophus ebraccatus TaxID=150705 RepID=UPI00383165A1